MTFRERLAKGSDPVKGSTILAYRIGKATPMSLPTVAALPAPTAAAGRRRNRVVL